MNRMQKMLRQIMEKNASSRKKDDLTMTSEPGVTYDETLIRQGSPNCFEDMPLEINWKITEACNYRCSYCFDAKGDYEENFCTIGQAERAIGYLASANRPSYHITITGGEPTTHPCFADIITLLGKQLGERIERITIITNGSFDTKVIDAIERLAPTVNIGISVSVHMEFASTDQIISLIEKLSKIVSLDFAIMLHPGFFDRVRELVNRLSELRKQYAFHMHISLLREPPDFTKDDRRYTEDHFIWRKDATDRFESVATNSRLKPPILPKNKGYEFRIDRVIDNRLSTESPIDLESLRELTGYKFQGMMCCAGAHIIHIQPDGTVRGAVCGHGRKRGNIYIENPFEMEDWIYAFECKKSRCGCNVDYRIPKFLDPDEAEEFIRKCRQRQAELLKEAGRSTASGFPWCPAGHR